MFVSKRVLVLLVVLASAGVGAAMYVALLASGVQGQASTVVAAPAAAPDAKPVRVKLDVSGLADVCTPVATDTGNGGGGNGGGNTIESGDFATNSGTIDGSQFNDGGFGDIGQQWWNVTVTGPVTNVNVGDNSSATVGIDTTGSTATGAAVPPAPTTTTTAEPPASTPAP